MALAEVRRFKTGGRVFPNPPTVCAQEVISQARDDQATLARLPIKRAAYSPAEFAATCGRHPSWAYRLLYGGKVRALTDLGRILIPASELERVLSCAAPYNPKARKPKTQQSGATIEVNQ